MYDEYSEPTDETILGWNERNDHAGDAEPHDREDLAMADHLIPTTSDRGFRHLPPISGEYGGEVRVYESSDASGPHVWLRVAEQGGAETAAHLTAENAWRLADQLRWLVEHHYQGDARPDED